MHLSIGRYLLVKQEVSGLSIRQLEAAIAWEGFRLEVVDTPNIGVNLRVDSLKPISGNL